MKKSTEEEKYSKESIPSRNYLGDNDPKVRWSSFLIDEIGHWPFKQFSNPWNIVPKINNYMKNQFIYTKTVVIPTEEGKEPETKTFKESMNVNKIIRAVTAEDGNVIVILDDFNERVRQVPDIDTKHNKMRGMKSVRETVQSEIILSPEDGERFFNLLNIE